MPKETKPGGRRGKPPRIVAFADPKEGVGKTSLALNLKTYPGSTMPREDLLPQLANAGRLLVIENPSSPWVKALRPLLGRVMELR